MDNGRKTLLVIDEETYLLRHFVHVAESAGYHAKGTSRVSEGLELAKQLRPDVILLNTLPPERDGMRLCQQVKAEPALAGVAVMMLAAETNAVEKPAMQLDIDVDEYVFKPITSRELLTRVQAMLRVKNAEARLAKVLHDLQQQQSSLPITQQQPQKRPAPPSFAADARQVFYESLPVACCTIDKYGMIVEANELAAGHCGVQRQRLLDTFFPDYLDEDDVGKFYLHLAKVFEIRDRQTCELRLAASGGAPRYVRLDSLVLRETPLEQLDRCSTIITDITSEKQRQAQPSKSEQLPSAVFLKNLSEVLLLTTDDGTLTFVSPNVTSIWGDSPEEIRKLGKISHLFGHEVVSPAELMSRRAITNIEYQLTDAAGATKWLLISVKRVTVKGGTILYACRDITDYKQRMQERHAAPRKKAEPISEDFFAGVTLEAAPATAEAKQQVIHNEESPDFMYIYDLQKQRIVSPGQHIAEFLGYPPQAIQQMEPMVLETLLHPVDLTSLDLLRLQWETAADDEVLETEYRLKAADEEWRWFRATEKVLLRDDDGQVIQIIGSAWTISHDSDAGQTPQPKQTGTLLSSVYEAFPDAVLETDLPGTIVHCNQKAVDLFGCESKADLLAKNLVDLLTKEDRPRFEEELRNCVDHQTVQKAAYTFCKSTGDTFPAEFSAQVIDQPSGIRTGLVVNIHNTSERDQAEEQLYTFATAVDRSPGMVLMMDAKGSIEYVNARFCEVTGYEAEDVLGQHPRMFRSDAQPPELYRTIWKTVQAGTSWQGILSSKKKDGEMYWETASIMPLTDVDGQITHFLKISEDITKSEQLQLQTDISRRELQALIEHVHDGITLSDASGYFEIFNPRMEQITGYSKAEADASDDFLAALYPDPKSHQQAVVDQQKVFETGQSQQSVTTIQAKGGTQKTLQVSTCLVKTPDQERVLRTYAEIAAPKTPSKTTKPRTTRTQRTRRKSPKKRSAEAKL